MTTLKQFTARLGVALGVAFAVASPAASAGPAQPDATAAQAGAAQPAAAVPLAAELAQVRREQARLASTSPGPGAPLLEQRRNAASRLALLLEARRQDTASTPAPAAAAPTLPGDPPYATADVDKLRDQRDAAAAQRASLELSVRALDGQIESLLQAGRKADETLRLRQEQFASANRAEDLARLRAQLDLAQMQARIAAIEASRADEHRSAARLRLQRLSESIEALDREIERVRRGQKIDDAALTLIGQSVDTERRRIAGLRDTLASKLVAIESRRSDADSPLSREIDALRSTLAALGELDRVERAKLDTWRLRLTALTADDAERRSAAEASLTGTIARLDTQLRAVSEQLEFARAGMRGQRSRLEGLAPGDPGRPAEQRALEACDQEVHAHEQLQDAIARQTVMLRRSRDDMGLAQRTEGAGDWLDRAAARVLGVARGAWEYELFSVGETTRVDGRAVTVDYGVTVGKSIGALLLFGLGYWLSRHVTRKLGAWMVSRAQVSPQLAKVLQRWMMSILLLVVVLMVLRMARIPLTAFAFMGGALAIGVGFGAQTVIRNVISGVIILFERKIRVGDIVTIGGMSGTVTAVDLRATTVRGFDGIESILPNSSLLEHQVSNWTYQNPTVRRTITVGVAYDSDVRRAADILAGCARDHPATLDTPPPEVLFDDFGPDAIVLKLQFWIRLGGGPPGPNVESDLRFAIEAALRAARIAIPVPQREVRIVTPAPRPDGAPAGSGPPA